MTSPIYWKEEPLDVFAADCPCCGKNLDKLLQPTILLALSKGPLYGTDIVYAASYGPLCSGTPPDPTGVYRYLKKMEEANLLTSRWETDRVGNRPKRLYTLTAQGAACRNRWISALRKYAAAVETLVHQLERFDSGTFPDGISDWDKPGFD